MTANDLSGLIAEIMINHDPEDVSLIMKQLIIEINNGRTEMPALTPEHIVRLIAIARDRSTCEYDRDFHAGCTAINLLGIFRCETAEVYGLLEESLLDIKAPACIRNHAARALIAISTHESKAILIKAEQAVSGWVSRPGHATFNTLLNIIRQASDDE